MHNKGSATMGGPTGADVKLNVQSLYSKQIKLIGSNGGSKGDHRSHRDVQRIKD